MKAETLKLQKAIDYIYADQMARGLPAPQAVDPLDESGCSGVTLSERLSRVGWPGYNDFEIGVHIDGGKAYIDIHAHKVDGQGYIFGYQLSFWAKQAAQIVEIYNKKD